MLELINDIYRITNDDIYQCAKAIVYYNRPFVLQILHRLDTNTKQKIQKYGNWQNFQQLSVKINLMSNHILDKLSVDILSQLITLINGNILPPNIHKVVDYGYFDLMINDAPEVYRTLKNIFLFPLTNECINLILPKFLQENSRRQKSRYKYL